MATGLSVSVLGDGSQLGVLLCAGDGVAARPAEVQYTLGDGPCVEAVRRRAPVFATDLTRVPDTRRRPLFSVQAARAGAEAVISLPLTGAGSALGTLDLYQDVPGAPSRGGVRTALLVADAVTLAVIALDHASPAPEGVVAWPAGAESDREEVHQATGMIMVRLEVCAEEALLRVRARAFAEGRTSVEIARAIIGRGLDLREDCAAEPSTTARGRRARTASRNRRRPLRRPVGHLHRRPRSPAAYSRLLRWTAVAERPRPVRLDPGEQRRQGRPQRHRRNTPALNTRHGFPPAGVPAARSGPGERTAAPFTRSADGNPCRTKREETIRVPKEDEAS